jgi:orotidine-5'-phosphate decarboxylase
VSADARRRLAFALDYPTLDAARGGVEQVHESAGVLKVGLELFVKEGPSAVRLADGLDCDVFLDLKLHDIPATVDRAVGTAAQLGVQFLTVHASGGPAMVEAAARRADKEGTGLTLLAVTVLTSLDEADLRATGVDAAPAVQVLRLARLALEAGAPGLVCSMHEVGALRAALGPEPILVTPGIRPAAGGTADQKRVGTPTDAIQAGSSVLVVGRPIRDADNPGAAARAILDEIARAGGGAT